MEGWFWPPAAASRFGAAKQLADLDGRPLLEYSLAAMTAAPVGRVVVVLGAGAEDVLARVSLNGAEPLVCARWEEGQSASLATGLGALSDCEAVVVTLGDQPRLSTDAIRRVIAARGDGAEAVRATYGGGPGHPVLLERSLFARLRDVTRRPRRAQPPAERRLARDSLRRPRGRRGRGHAGPARRTARGRPGGMRLEHSFQVAAPLERVWDALVDIERVAPCLPGAEIDEAGEDGSYRGSFTVKLGPTTAAYRGELAMEELDAAAHRSVMRASGTDKRGQGSAKATIVSTMREDGDVTTVEVETDFTITGRLARFGRGGMIQDVSNRLLRDFSDCLQKTIEAAEPVPAAQAPPSPPAAKPVGGISLFLRALLDRLRRALRGSR